jgi:prolyl oligopeptidase
MSVEYPKTRRDDTVDDYHGHAIADPYRWMENLEAPDLRRWIDEQNAVTDRYLQALPLRAHFRERITALWDYPKVSVPIVEAGRLFYQRNTGLQKQAAVYLREPGDRRGDFREPVLVLDPNTLSPDGATALMAFAPSPDGRLLAYTLAEGGADWQTVHVADLQVSRDLDDRVRWMRFSALAWTHDSQGFFYSRFPEPPAGKTLEAALANHALYYHRLGTPQGEDRPIFARPDLPSWFVSGTVSDDGRYLLVALFEGATNSNRLYFADLGDPAHPDVTAAVRPVVEEDGAEYAPIGTSGTTLFVRSDRAEPNRCVLAFDLDRVAAGSRVIVPARQDTLGNVRLIGGRLLAEYLVDVQSRIETFDPSTGAPCGSLALPGPGVVSVLHGRADSPTAWLAFTSPLQPVTVYAVDLESGASTPFEPPAVPVDISSFVTRQSFATSRDGTRVPFFVTARKDLRLDGTNPAMMYGYGGFSVDTLPAYRPDVPAWLELGGVWVTVNMRGGGEYGEAWHRAGMRERKQNVFDDFIACAEQLVADGYTSPQHLSMLGGSNGGLLVGVVMEQRPELFAAAIPVVGVLDMLRYDRFTGGRAWVTEYGSSSDASDFAFLSAYSPLHNIAEGRCYPATLVCTADFDDRVVPSHSFKFTAALQRAQGCAPGDRPVLIRIETHGSHGYRPTDKRIAELADQWAFAAAHAGLTTAAVPVSGSRPVR